jgi:predicted 3-demethylubiquinone-9 3-methyltransferase (glyoxalase superfamily)
MSKKITPFLWFEQDAEAAVNYYLSVFKDSEILSEQRWGENGPVPAGTILTIEFRLNSQRFVALNGGPQYKFSPATSFVIECDTQEEVDHYWNSFADGGTPSMCGWIDDKYGVTWQVVPNQLLELLGDPNPGRAGRATQAMLQMQKIVIADLEAAANAE